MRPSVRAFAVILLAFITGCSSEGGRSNYARIVTPLPPAFLTGPGALLFTNVPGFSARAEIQGLGATHTISSGELLGRGTKFLYAPESGEQNDGARKPGDYSFIWDTAENRGYVLSEPLQGYAPLNSALHVTSMETIPGKSAEQRMSGHLCEATTVSTITAEGATNRFEVLRATDLKGLPVRIEGVNNTGFILTLSKVRFEQPSASVFSPPNGFTKYPTPESMADELAARQHNLKRRNYSPLDDLPMTEQRRY